MNQSPQKQETQFNQPAIYPYHQDEISLVDLAKTLIKRRNWLFGTFFIGLLITLLFAWVKRPQSIVENTDKAFTTLVAVGYKTPTVFIEPLAGIKTQLTDAFIPSASKGQIFSADVVIDEPKTGSNIVKLVTVAKENQGQKVSDFHKEILDPLLKRHIQLFNSLSNEWNAESIAIQDLQPIATSIASLAQPLSASNHEAKSKSTLVIILGTVLSAMLAIIVVFMREFASQVCHSIKEDK